MRDRYNLSNSIEPANGRAPGDTIAAVPDPYDSSARVRVTINRRVDVLEYERSHGLISHQAYAIGRMIQGIFERSRHTGESAGPWRESSTLDAWAHEHALVERLHAARQLQRHIDRMRAAIGSIDSRIVERMLGDGWSYHDVARERGRDGERGRWYVATRFRDALEVLADEYGATGVTSRTSVKRGTVAIGEHGE